ncbi:MAG: MgtC/SapB family protein [Oscillospiraceae bacterium]|nr:MgtC/SapB family protein [Oscillospiraceae bacterium]
MVLREVTILSVFLRIFAAVFIGGILGLERGMKNRPAGFRTYMLVCVGACVIMLTNQYIYQVTSTGDPVRMGAQVVSGIGFLGAGTIIVTRRNQIKGLTTAAGLWSAAGVGLALGVGFYEAAVAGTMAVFVVMALLQKMDNKLHRKSKQLEAYIELKEISLGDFLRIMRESDIDISDVQREYEDVQNDGVRAYVATLKGKQRQNHQELMEKVQAIPGVAFVEEL